MRKKICAGNWKMYKSPEEAQVFLSELLQRLAPEGQQLGLETVVFPSTLSLETASRMLKGAVVKWGAQNCHYEASGAFTGEISPQILGKMGAQYVLVGHSERRSLFHESDDLLAQKMLSAHRFGLLPILCIGESLHERESQETEAVLTRQVEVGLSQMPEGAAFVIAYEPVWAIGTGKVATPELANSTHRFVREKVAQLMGSQQAQALSILYGGSVKPDNAKALSLQKHIDGFLIGGASLKVDDFLSIRASLH